MVDCALPNNNCKSENKKCLVDTDQYSDEKFTKLNNEKKAKEYLNNLEKPEWTEKLTNYCATKDSVACATKNNACTFRLFKQKCEVDADDYAKKDNLKYIDNLEEIIKIINDKEQEIAAKKNTQ